MVVKNKASEQKLEAVENKRIVERAILHSATILPDGNTEANLNQSKLPGIKMVWVDGEGLLIELKGKKALIPSAGVKIVFFPTV